MKENKTTTAPGKAYVSPECTCLLVQEERNILSGEYSIPKIEEEDLDWD
jgi:hypothetical protein